MKNKTYDVLKKIALFVLPPLATFVGTIGQIWSIPYTDKIVLTITAVGTLLSGILGISTAKYKKEKSE